MDTFKSSNIEVLEASQLKLVVGALNSAAQCSTSGDVDQGKSEDCSSSNDTDIDPAPSPYNL